MATEVDEAQSAIREKLKKLTIPKLKIILRAYGCSTTGKKAQLQENVLLLTIGRSLKFLQELENIIKHVDLHSSAPSQVSETYTQSVNNHLRQAAEPVRSYPLSGAIRPNNPAPLQPAPSMVDPNFIIRPLYQVVSRLSKQMYAPAPHPVHIMEIPLQIIIPPEVVDKLESGEFRLMFLCANVSTPKNAYHVFYPYTADITLDGVQVEAIHRTRGIKGVEGTTRPVDFTKLWLSSPARRLKRSQLKLVFKRHTDSKDDKTHQQSFAGGVYLVRAFSPEFLIDQVNRRPHILVSEDLKIIKGDEDDDVVAMQAVHSLYDPYTFSRMKIPIRSRSCDHIDCVDAESFLKILEQGPNWKCVHCNAPITWESMAIDDLMLDILCKTDPAADKVSINEDATWNVLSTDGDEGSSDDERQLKIYRPEPEIIDILSDTEDELDAPAPASAPAPVVQPVVQPVPQAPAAPETSVTQPPAAPAPQVPVVQQPVAQTPAAPPATPPAPPVTQPLVTQQPAPPVPSIATHTAQQTRARTQPVEAPSVEQSSPATKVMPPVSANLHTPNTPRTQSRERSIVQSSVASPPTPDVQSSVALQPAHGNPAAPVRQRGVQYSDSSDSFDEDIEIPAHLDLSQKGHSQEQVEARAANISSAPDIVPASSGTREETSEETQGRPRLPSIDMIEKSFGMSMFSAGHSRSRDNNKQITSQPDQAAKTSSSVGVVNRPDEQVERGADSASPASTRKRKLPSQDGLQNLLSSYSLLVRNKVAHTASRSEPTGSAASASKDSSRDRSQKFQPQQYQQQHHTSQQQPSQQQSVYNGHNVQRQSYSQPGFNQFDLHSQKTRDGRTGLETFGDYIAASQAACGSAAVHGQVQRGYGQPNGQLNGPVLTQKNIGQDHYHRTEGNSQVPMSYTRQPQTPDYRFLNGSDSYSKQAQPREYSQQLRDRPPAPPQRIIEIVDLTGDDD